MKSSDCRRTHKGILVAISALLVLPLYFQIDGTIFNDRSYSFNSMGDFNRLPVPVSLVACFLGLTIIGNLKLAKKACYMVVSTLIIMAGTTYIATDGMNELTADKLILLIQFILPMFALVLGQTFGAQEEQTIFIKTALFIVISIIPIQVLTALISGKPILSPSIIFFSIYQHLQYVPTIFISLYLIGLFTYWDKTIYKKTLIASAPLIGMYAQFSLSMLTNFILYSGVVLFCVYRWFKFSDKMPVVFSILIFIASIATYWNYKEDDNFLQKYNYQKSSIATETNKHSSNVTGRINIWRHYISKIAADKKILLFGNAKRPNRSKYPSAHNYYLDMTYNLGFLSLIPLIVLFGVTLQNVYCCKLTVVENPVVFALTYVTFFLLIVDNSLKVSLRQPYPGIITFFLWGYLLSSLSKSTLNRAK